jgi:hypothetical protein
LNEKIEQFERETGTRNRMMETVGRERHDIAETSRARTKIVKEVVPVVDLNLDLQRKSMVS